MGLFDFWKKKNKEPEEEQQFAEEQQPEAEGLDIEGLDIEMTPKAQEDFVLNVDESLTETTALNRAVRDAMKEQTVTLHQKSGGVLHEEGVEENAPKEEPAENTEEAVAEEVPVEEMPEETEEAPQAEEMPEEAEEAPEAEEMPEETEEVPQAEEMPEEVEEAPEAEEMPEEVEEAPKAEEVPEEAEVEEVPEEAEVEEVQVEEIPEETKEETDTEEKHQKKGFFARLKEGLDKTRKNILDGVDSVLGSFTKIDEDLFEELEETLIMADMGVQTTMDIVENLRQRVKRERATDPSLIKGMLIDEITTILQEDDTAEENLPSPTVMLVIGVNGVGKTTTIGKLANNFKGEGKKVLLAAADTFRAAAIDQLEVWGQRAGIEVIKHEENADPAAVVYDAVHAAKNKKSDLLICDTAGRLHNKKNLMEELRKISRVIEREYTGAHRETYLVLDATTGQNALQQAKLFQEVADISGIILTKLDGTAKGGIVVAIKSELKIPVRYIGVGEGIDDLQKFDASEFAKALFGEL